jgi:parallel beta-helix repeat protein
VVLAAVSLAAAPASAGAPVLHVECGSSAPAPPLYPTIASALKAWSGQEIHVTGTCYENVFVSERFDSLVLIGNPIPAVRAVIVGQPSQTKEPPISIRGAGNVTVRGFTVQTQTTDGIFVYRGGAALLDNNVVDGIPNPNVGGIIVSQASFARIVNSTISNNAGYGILVGEASAARIGFLSGDDLTAQPNVIEGNGLAGIIVTRSSTARIVGNDIRGNGAGIRVGKVSQADIAANDISGSTTDGIVAIENSGVNLAIAAGNTPMFTTPNSSTTPNDGYGVVCQAGAYVSGRLGTLSGHLGSMETADARTGKAPWARVTCIDNLEP